MALVTECLATALGKNVALSKSDTEPIIGTFLLGQGERRVEFIEFSLPGQSDLLPLEYVPLDSRNKAE